MPFPADRMLNVNPFYHTLVVGKATRSPSLVVGEYEAGRILVQTAHPSTQAFHPFSDEVYMRMVNWTAKAETGCEADAFEPDDTSSTGSTLVIGEDQRHSLCPQNDEDWANFQVSTTRSVNGNLLVETFNLEPDSVNPDGDTQLTVLDESATNQIGTNQDRGYGPFPGSIDVVQSSRVVWHPAAGGLFNIKVFPETQINKQGSTGYSLHLANLLSLCPKTS